MLGMQWKDGVYIDTGVTFGLRLVPKLFNILSELLAWIAKESYVFFLVHFLDDFLTIGRPSSSCCQHNLDAIIQICSLLDVQLVLEKIEGPLTTLPFLDIVLYTITLEATLPKDKLYKLREQVSQWVGRKDAKNERFSL